MRSLRAALTAPLSTLVALALLAGCSDDAPSPGDPTSIWTPTSKPETPTSKASAAPTDPPEAATRQTRAGAEAFARYYWATVNYALETGNSAPLRATIADGCAAL